LLDQIEEEAGRLWAMFGWWSKRGNFYLKHPNRESKTVGANVLPSPSLHLPHFGCQITVNALIPE